MHSKANTNSILHHIYHLHIQAACSEQYSTPEEQSCLTYCAFEDVAVLT